MKRSEARAQNMQKYLIAFNDFATLNGSIQSQEDINNFFKKHNINSHATMFLAERAGLFTKVAPSKYKSNYAIFEPSHIKIFLDFRKKVMAEYSKNSYERKKRRAYMKFWRERNVSENQTKLIDIPSEPPRFKKPTLDEVVNYCNARGNNVDPDRFINYYESKGWMVGKSPMKDWQGAIRTWERNIEAPQQKIIIEQHKQEPANKEVSILWGLIKINL